MPEPQDPQNPTPPTGYFSQADVDEAIKQAKQQARTEERDKLYPQIDANKTRFDELTSQIKTLTDAESERAKEAEKARLAAEKARQAKEDAEKSAQDLVKDSEARFQQQLKDMQTAQDTRLAEIAQQQQLQQAVFEKEREMSALQMYIRDRVEAERENIAPELLDFITGDTKEEVDASIQVVKDKTAAIVEGMRQAGIAQRASMPGTAPSAGATSIVPGLDTGQGQAISAEDIKGMGMKEFAALRQRMGMGNAGQGIFQ
jgi:hypothetical protein